MRWADSSTEASGYGFNVPWITGRFRSFNIICPPPGEPTRADQTPACIQMAIKLLCLHGSPLLSQSHVEAISATSVVLRTALLSIPKLLRPNEPSAKPLRPTSNGRHLALHPAYRQLLTSPEYLASFRRLLPSTLPMAQLAQAAPLVWWT